MDIFEKDTVTVTTTKIIDLRAIRAEIASLDDMANDMKLIDYSGIRGLTDEIIEVLNEENQRRELIISDLSEDRRLKVEELASYD